MLEIKQLQRQLETILGHHAGKVSSVVLGDRIYMTLTPNPGKQSPTVELTCTVKENYA